MLPAELEQKLKKTHQDTKRHTIPAREELTHPLAVVYQPRDRERSDSKPHECATERQSYISPQEELTHPPIETYHAQATRANVGCSGGRTDDRKNDSYVTIRRKDRKKDNRIF